MRMLLSTLFASLVLAACSPSPQAETPAPAAEVASAPASAQPAAADGPAEFQTPTGNIGCTYTPAGGTEIYSTADGAAELKCDRVEPAYVRIVLPEHAAARVEDTQERGCCGGETLAYGTHWSAGPFQCDVAETGLTCASAEGHGFTLSRQAADVR